jgi:DNA-binding GntR family transcriptional regulator
MSSPDSLLDRAPASAEAEAYAYLLGRIRQGLLAPGARLRAEEIATEIGMSRMPVREALRRLDSEGLVTLRPNRGAVVAGYKPKEILELFEMRSVLEGLAARLAAPHIGEEQLAEMHDLVAHMARGESEGGRWIGRHWAFHAYVCGLSGRLRLMREIERMHTVLEPYLRIWFTKVNKPMHMVDDHQALIRVLATRDPGRAEAAMREHVLITAPAVIAFIEAYLHEQRG